MLFRSEQLIEKLKEFWRKAQQFIKKIHLPEWSKKIISGNNGWSIGDVFTVDYSFANLKNAIVQGANVASFCIEKFGAERLLTLTHNERTARLQQFRDLTQFDIQVSGARG